MRKQGTRALENGAMICCWGVLSCSIAAPTCNVIMIFTIILSLRRGPLKLDSMCRLIGVWADRGYQGMKPDWCIKVRKVQGPLPNQLLHCQPKQIVTEGQGQLFLQQCGCLPSSPLTTESHIQTQWTVTKWTVTKWQFRCWRAWGLHGTSSFQSGPWYPEP